MSVDLQAIREALASQLRANISKNINCYSYDVGAGTFPAITIDAGSPYIAYHESFGDRALAGIELVLRITTTSADGASSWLLMDSLLSPGLVNTMSVLEAVELDSTLGGVVANVWVSSASEPRFNESGHLVCELACHVLANKSKS